MSKLSEARSRISRGHASADAEHDLRRQRQAAAMFRPNERMERVARLAKDGTRLSPQSRIELGLYLEAKAAHEAVEAADAARAAAGGEAQ